MTPAELFAWYDLANARRYRQRADDLYDAAVSAQGAENDINKRISTYRQLGDPNA